MVHYKALSCQQNEQSVVQGVYSVVTLWAVKLLTRTYLGLAT